jgi:ABC-type transporter MlaC component
MIEGKSMLRAWFGAAVLCMAAAVAHAQGAQGAQAQDPNVFIKSAVETVVKAAKADPAAQNGDVAATAAVVRREFLPYTDFERSTRLAVGSAWKDATPEQQRQLVQQFTELLVGTYALQLTQVRGQDLSFSFQPASVGSQGNDAVVHTEVKGMSGGDMEVGYRIARTPAGWRIYDIDNMGVWLIQLYQGQFAGQLARGGIDGLVKYLTDHNARLSR